MGGERKSLVSTVCACALLSPVQTKVGGERVLLIHLIGSVTYAITNTSIVTCSEE